ncbi:MAG: ParA family partition ATPase [Gammaproteobacteria bacterium]
MPIVVLVGNKGGAGKTTLAVNLAMALARRANTLLLDADPQGSSLQWLAMAEGHALPDVMDPQQDLVAQVRELSQRYKNIVVDCPPSVQAPQTHAALQVCDLAIIPVQPSPVDLWATVHIQQAIEQAKRTNPKVSAWLVINQLEARTTLSRLVRDAVEEIDLPVARTAIRRRAIYRSSALEGKSVFDTGSRGAAAVAELNQLIEEVFPS